jgi:periplasmic mercuric ion binding protein
MRGLLFSFLIALAPFAAHAASPQSVVLDVQNMTCDLCSVTVKKSLEKVPGVSQARIIYASKTATVSFDADRTSTAALIKATTEAGFPSSVRK